MPLISAAALVLTLSIQLAGWYLILRPGLAAAEPERVRAALRRWVRFELAVNVAVIVAALAYVTWGPSWGAHSTVLTGLAAVAGNAFPIQIIMIRLLNRYRRI